MVTLDPQLETIARLSPEIRAGRRTCIAVLEDCLAKIDEWESRVRAWVVIDRDGALQQARSLDQELANGRWRGPLHGIPLGIKDIMDVAGLPTAAGFRPWSDRLAKGDAPIVARLRSQGAVILGKTVTTTFAWIDPPVTRNPWNLERTPGGSSSGSAAAVACGMCLGALGSQTGGSITRPASFCGVAGLKPTHGRLDVAGIVPLAPTLDHPGPIAQTVADLKVLWDGLAGSQTEEDSRRPSASAPRLGRLRGLFHDRAEPAARDAVERALQRLTSAGASVNDVALPAGFGTVIRSHRVIMAAEAAAWHQTLLAESRAEYPPRIRELVEEGLAIRAVDYVQAREHRDRLCHEMVDCFAEVDALVTPATIGPAPDTSTTGDPLFNSPWSYTGLPTVSFPIGRSPDGLPLAIQLVGKAFAEQELLATAGWCEEVTR